MFPTLNEGVHVELRGQGPFAVRRGQVTEETQMATVLAMSLRNLQRYDVFDTAKDYQRWMPHAFDINPHVKSALGLVAEGKHPEFTGKRVWLESNQRAASNASITRCPPIGLFFRWDQPARILATLEDAQITHFAPICQLAGVIVNAVIAAANTTAKEHLEKADALKVIEAELSIAAAQLGKMQPDWVTQVKDAADWLRDDIRAAQNDDPMLYGPELHLHLYENRVRECLRVSLWELWHAPSFSAALIDVVNRGGDADANGSLTGALMGAVHGDTAIPEEWATPVLELNGQGPLYGKYHPRELMTLAQNLPNRPAAPVKKPPPPRKEESGGGGD
jgi:ADP-ribosylglycohydrolase